MVSSLSVSVDSKASDEDEEEDAFFGGLLRLRLGSGREGFVHVVVPLDAAFCCLFLILAERKVSNILNFR